MIRIRITFKKTYIPVLQFDWTLLQFYTLTLAAGDRRQVQPLSHFQKCNVLRLLQIVLVAARPRHALVSAAEIHNHCTLPTVPRGQPALGCGHERGGVGSIASAEAYASRGQNVAHAVAATV